MSGHDVLVVITSAQRRGAEIEGAQTAEMLTNAGIDADVVALAAASAGSEPLDVPVLGPSSLHPQTLRSLRRRARRASLVVAYGSRALPATALALAGTKTPFLYRSIGDPRAWAGGRLRRLRTAASIRQAREVVALWPGAADDIADLYGVARARVMVVPNARSATRFAPCPESARVALREELGLPHDGIVVGWAGALTAEKQPGLAIEVVAAMGDAILVMAGGGKLAAELQDECRNKLGERARFLGQLKDIRPLLHASDVILITSKTEGMPGVAIEAGLCGRPVVSTPVGAVAEIVEHGRTGLLSEPSPDLLAGCVRSASLQQAQMGRAARERCGSLFEVSLVGRQWTEIVNRHLSETMR